MINSKPGSRSQRVSIYNSLEIETRTEPLIIRKILEEVEGYDEED